MGLVEPYKGTYCSARSANEELDIQTIMSGCDAVDSAASHLSDHSAHLSWSSGTLTADNFSVNEKTILGTVDECCNNIENVESFILGATSQIRGNAEAAYNQIQNDLNDEAYQKDMAERNRRNAKSEKESDSNE
ncbi:MAG: hypothetical protein J6X28_03640 [Bacilli bacterium]|nr:hypothetical protein [Bacilli bacterium]